MSLQLILGGSGAGKSQYLYHRIIKESMENPKKNYLVIVPEQMTMETQKDFITMHEHHGIMNIDVLSFMRLSYRVMEEMGKNEVMVLEDTGKNMVLRRVLEENAGRLTYFKSNIRKPGFIDEVKSMLSELYQYSIGEDALAEMIQLAKGKPLLQAKLQDLFIIYKEFRDFLQEKYITAEEIMDVLYEELDASNIIKNSVICLDGFTGFTPSQYKVLEQLMRLSDKVYATVTIDKRENLRKEGEEFELFHLSKKTIKKLENIAFNQNKEVLDPIFPEKEEGVLWRFCENEALLSLEKNLFRYPWKAYQKEQESVAMQAFKTPKEEVRFVVYKIKKMIQKKKYRYRDFAVISGDIKNYGRLILEEFKEANIPYFMDEKREIKKNPFVILINSVLDLARKQMDYETMFHYLRSGMLPFEKDEIDALENYCLAFGIRGKKRWSQEFTKCLEGMEEEKLAEINLIRERVVDSLKLVFPILSKKTHSMREYVETLYDMTTNLQVFETLSKMEESFVNKGEVLIAKEYAEVYRLVMEIFERMVELLGEEELTILEFKDIFNAGIDKAKVGVIPSGIDQVVVGDMERTRLKDIKVLFFIGVNDGVVPTSIIGGGILSDMERELLKEKKIELAPTKREQIYIERFYLYLNLTKPSESVYLTFCKTDFSGKAIKASYLIGKIEQLFPKILVEKEETDWEKILRVMYEDGGKTLLLEGIREFSCDEKENIYWQKIYSWYLQKDKLNQTLIDFIESSYREEDTDKLSKAVAKALYGNHLIGSVTRLEKFAACACAHFLAYGLKIKERQEFKINIPDMGNIFHAALELFSKKLTQQNQTWKSITTSERERLAEECVKEVTKEYGNTILHSSMRNEYMIERITRILKRTLWALTKQLSLGEFEPSGYELRFSFLDNLDSVKLSLEEEQELSLTGRIDRVDLCKKADDIYVKIIDYKSGKKRFSITDLYYGLELQLIVYIGTILEKTRKDYPDKNVIPAGVFYYNIDDPIIDKTDDLFYEDTLLKELRVNGLLNEESKVIKLFDHSFGEEKEELRPCVKSNVIPVETKKTGELSRYSSTICEKDFETIISYVRNKMVDFGNGIMEGHCEKNPFKLGEKTACDYCQYNAVCGFDKKNATDHYRVLESIEKDEVFEKIRAYEVESEHKKREGENK